SSAWNFSRGRHDEGVMGIARGHRVALAGIAVVTAVGAVGCGQGTTASPHGSAEAPFGAPVVSLLGEGGRPVRVVGGTSAMRARAQEILDGMGAVAISEVRFGRPPAPFGQFRGVKGPIWLSTVVRARGNPIDGGLRAELLGD